MLIPLALGAQAATHVWNVHSLYGGIDGAKLQAAVNSAVSYRSSNPNDTVILNLNAGTYFIEEEVNIDNLPSGGTGWLIIRGQGIGATELVDTEYADNGGVTFEGSKVHRLKISDMSISGERMTGSQGSVVALTSSQVDIELDAGFPVPTELFETETQTANKMRLMDDSDPDNPHYVEYPGNDHYSYRISWQGSDTGSLPVHLYDRVWRFFTNEDPPYQVGDRLAISSKSKRSNWGSFGKGGSNIVFENLALKRLGRIKFRHQNAATWDGIRFTNVSISRSQTNGITQLYSTDAGPQFGHDPDGGSVQNLVVENCDFRGTTDDGSAFQLVTSGYATGNRWEDGGGTLVGQNCTAGLVFSNNVHYHCPLEENRLDGDGIHYKGAYDFAPTRGSVSGTSAMLNWKAGSKAELHDVYFGTANPPPFVGRQSATNYAIAVLQPGTTYYWRVNEYHSVLGANEGDLQRFTVADSTINFSDIWADGSWAVDTGTPASYTLGAFGQTTQLLTFNVGGLSLDYTGTADDSITVKVRLTGSNLINLSNGNRWAIEGVKSNRIEANEMLGFSFDSAFASLGGGETGVLVNFLGFTGLEWQERATGNWFWTTNAGTTVTNIPLNTDLPLSFDPSHAFVVGGSSNSLCEGRVRDLSFAVGISNTNDSPFEIWADTYLLTEGPEGHDDGDHLTNLEEFGLGGDPTNGADIGHVPTLGNGGSGLEYIHVQRKDSGLTYCLETTDDLVSNVWTNGDYSIIGTNTIDADFDVVTNAIPAFGKSNGFIRLKMEM
jgi:hypothetical protein